MILLVMSVRDNVSEAFLPPFYARAKGEAIRSFMDACLNDNGAFVKHRVDYDLYQIGFFDDTSGGLEPLTAVERVITGKELAAKDGPFGQQQNGIKAS